MKMENEISINQLVIPGAAGNRQSSRYKKGITTFITPGLPVRCAPPTGNDRKGAFTLIELLVVVLIIGILTAVAVPQYTMTVKVSRLKSQLPLARSLLEAQRRFHLENGAYSSDLNLLDITSADQCDGKGNRCSFGKTTMQAAGGTYYGVLITSGLPDIYVFYASGSIQCQAGGSDTTNEQNKICQRATGLTTPSSTIITANYYMF